MKIIKTTLMATAVAALLFPLAGQAQGGRDAYTDLRIVVRSGNQEIGSIEPGATLDVPGGSRVRLVMSAYAPGRGANDRPIYPVTRYSEETPGRGITIVESNPENANATIEIAPLGNQQRSRTDVIRYEISDPDGRIPDRLERGTVRINVVSTGSATAPASQGSVGGRAEELTRVLYNAILLRDPDTGARGTTEAIQRNGYDALVDQAVRIAGSDESRIQVYEKEGVCNEKRLLSLYRNLLGIDASQIDRRQWDADLQRMNSGQIAQVVNDLVRSDRFRSRYSVVASQ